MKNNSEIENNRIKIDKIDQDLLMLLNDRAKLALDIRKIKKQEGLALFDAKREEHIIQELSKINNGPLYDENIRKIFKEIFKTMRGLPDVD